MKTSIDFQMSDFRVVCFSKATGINSLIVLGLNEQDARREAYRWINFHGFNWIVKYAQNLTVKPTPMDLL